MTKLPGTGTSGTLSHFSQVMLSNSTTTVTATCEEAGERLDRVLLRHVPSVSRAKLQKAIAEGLVEHNDAAARKNAVVREGDRITINLAGLERIRGTELAAQDMPLSILYEDPHIVAVNKEAGMVVHPGSGNRDGTLVNALLYHVAQLSSGTDTGRPGIVHRLDKETSGVMLVAKTDEAHAAFARLFSSREIAKTYVGVCIGALPRAHGVIDAPLGRSRHDPIRQSVRTEGRDARTEYWCMAHRCGVSLLRFRPHTGRTHQIRLHARHAGFPVIGDHLYGGGRKDILRLEPLDRPFAHSVAKCFRRHALHARTVEFAHPFTGENARIEAPFPADFAAAIPLFGLSEDR
ncbi:MAG: RluA family pseudouridine synthase [Chitinivibrionales bacterium]|nr:RluA family pseudouridine synthase [Chitinivibrionales bacterium]MBD3397161.1 RluA family pseudouridine synthase [Chitinivibrionales bacterium]